MHKDRALELQRISPKNGITNLRRGRQRFDPTAEQHIYTANSESNLTLYFREISRIPLLTRTQEIKLAQTLEAGNIALKELSDDGLDLAPLIEQGLKKKLRRANRQERH